MEWHCALVKPYGYRHQRPSRGCRGRCSGNGSLKVDQRPRQKFVITAWLCLRGCRAWLAILVHRMSFTIMLDVANKSCATCATFTRHSFMAICYLNQAQYLINGILLIMICDGGNRSGSMKHSCRLANWSHQACKRKNKPQLHVSHLVSHGFSYFNRFSPSHFILISHFYQKQGTTFLPFPLQRSQNATQGMAPTPH